MSTLVKIQILIELQSAFFCLVIGLLLLFSMDKLFKGGKILAAAVFDNMILLLCDVTAFIVNGRMTPLGTILVRVSTFLVFALEYLLLVLFSLYIFHLIRDVRSEYRSTNRNVVIAAQVINFLLLIGNVFLGYYYRIDEQNVYHRGPCFPVSSLLAVVSLLFLAVMLAHNWRYLAGQDRLEIFMFLLWPVIGIVLQLMVYGISFEILGTTFSIVTAFAAYIVRLNRWSQKKELAILKSQAYLLNSQIKPHFLFNSLNVIQSLIEDDPETAVVAVNHFSKYLRAGMKMEIMDSLVPLATEMDYVNDYLFLEQLRHGKKIRVEKNIQTGIDFKLPFLTIQPIVENAIRHGICKKIKGGTVSISIEREDKFYVIRVSDDGVGYLPLIREEKEWDPDQPASSGVGSVNVKNRLAIMCNGTLETDSVPGKGTTVTIRIPVE